MEAGRSCSQLLTEQPATDVINVEYRSNSQYMHSYRLENRLKRHGTSFSRLRSPKPTTPRSAASR